MRENIYIHKGKVGDFEFRQDEMIRYMGQDKSKATKDIIDLVSNSLDEVKRDFTFKTCYSKFKIELKDNFEIDLGFAKTNSTNLYRNLENCKEIYVFVATLGLGIDRKIKRYTDISPVKSLAFQGVGSGAIEDYCNYFNKYIKILEEDKGNKIKPRFSPGYGDLDLNLQKDIFNALEVTKKIGVVLNDSLLMTPSKSVSAIIGVYK